MSFREIRNLTEMMRSLGFPRLISVENFRTPNFALVAEILSWMVERYDPDIVISDVIDTENDRVEFLTSICQSLASKAHLKLNAKRLYAADGFAVKELLKLATLLYSAARVQSAIQSGTEAEDMESVPVGAQLPSIKEARTLATDITDKGAKLYDLLAGENEVRKARLKAMAFLDAISGNLESTSEHQYIEKSLREIIHNVQENMSSMMKQVEDLEADEKSLDSKIKKKTADLERGEKRLKSLQTVRPAFMDEYEKLEKELQRYYEIYMEKFRNLDYLEHELDKINKAEQEKVEQAAKRIDDIARKLRDEEAKLFRGGDHDIDEQETSHFMSNKPSKDADRANGAQGRSVASAQRNPPNRRQSGKDSKLGQRNQAKKAEVKGHMVAAAEEESESSDGEGDEDASDDESSETEQVSIGSGGSGSEEQDVIDDDEDGSEMSDENQQDESEDSGF